MNPSRFITEAARKPRAFAPTGSSRSRRRSTRRAKAAPGDLVFVPGATGGVGVQLAGAVGVRTVGTSSSASKLDRLEEMGLNYAVWGADIDDLREAVREVGTPDAVLNHLGGRDTELGLDVLRRGGRMVVCGQTAGRRSEIDAPDLFLGHKRLIGSTMGTQTAFAAMQNREGVGKLVVTTCGRRGRFSNQEALSLDEISSLAAWLPAHDRRRPNPTPRRSRRFLRPFESAS